MVFEEGVPMESVNEWDLAKLEAEFAVSRKEKMLANKNAAKSCKSPLCGRGGIADASLIRPS